MTLTLSFAARSDVGLVRSVNQDSGYAGPHLLAVADGMGGAAAGDVASAVAISHLAPLDTLDLAAVDPDAVGPQDPAGPDVFALLRDAVAAAHIELRERAAQDPSLRGMGTTVIAALRRGNLLSMVHIGDSRAYLARDGAVSQLTADHTYVQHLVDLGELTPQEAAEHPQRSMLLRVLGDHDLGVELDESVRELAAGDRFLLCSDGVSSYVSARAIARTLLAAPDAATCADTLVMLALKAGGPDNITAIVGDVVPQDPEGEAAPSQLVGAAAQGTIRPPGATTDLLPQDEEPTDTALEPVPDDDDAAAAPSPETAPSTDHAGSQAADTPGTLEASHALPPTGKRRRRGAWVAVLTALLLLVVAGGAWAGYAWTQTRHFVAGSGDYVAVYQGIPTTIGPVTLSRPVETTDLRLDALPTYARARLVDGIAPDDGSLEGARGIVENLRAQVEPSEATTAPAPDATSSPSPTPTASATPTPASPSPSGISTGSGTTP